LLVIARAEYHHFRPTGGRVNINGIVRGQSAGEVSQRNRKGSRERPFSQRASLFEGEMSDARCHTRYERMDGMLVMWEGLYAGTRQRWSRKARRTIRMREERISKTKFWRSPAPINNPELEKSVNEWWRRRITKQRKKEEERKRKIFAAVIARRKAEELEKETNKRKEQAAREFQWDTEQDCYYRQQSVD
jgi:hypothetical protein